MTYYVGLLEGQTDRYQKLVRNTAKEAKGDNNSS